jgi:hypothetical protein
MAKAKKPRSDKYEKKLAIKGGFGDVMKVAVANPPDKPKEKTDSKEKQK